MMITVRKAIHRQARRESWQWLTKTDQVNVGEFERLASIIGGSGLVLYAVMRRSAGSLGPILTGHCPAYETVGISTASRAERLQYKTDDRTQYRTDAQPRVERTIEPDSVVDEMAWESFPASDPPASW